MTLSGTLYSDEGVTTITSGKTIAIAVGTTTTSIHSATSNGSGVWTFDLGAAVSIPTSTPITIWVDGDSTTRASLFTKASSSQSNITGLDLYQDRVILSHEGTSGTSTTISNMSFYDYDNDSDIQYNAATSTSANTLTIFSNQELHIKTGKTFAPGGNVTINANASTTSPTDGNFHLPGTATYTAGGATTVGGNFTASGTVTFTPGTYTTTMNATTTGKTVYVPLTTMGNLTFNGSAGAWTMGTTSTTSRFLIQSGAVTAPSTTLAITGNYTNSDTFNANGGTLSIQGSNLTDDIMRYVAGRDVSGNAAGTGALDVYSLVISGTMLYVGTYGGSVACSQTAGSATGCELMVFDISSSTNPVYVAGRDVSGNASGTGFGPIYSLVISGTTLYVGKSGDATACSQTAGSAIGCELMAFDISSSTNPVYVAGRDESGNAAGTGSNYIFTLALSGTTLYVGKGAYGTACSQTAGSATGCELMAFDISSSTNPVYAAGRDVSGNASGLEALDINLLVISGTTLYVGKYGDTTACSQTAGSAIGCELMAFDISSSTNPVYVAGRDETGNASGTGFNNISTLVLSGATLYVGKSGWAPACSQTAGSASGCELMAFDISSSTNPVYVAGRDESGNASGSGSNYIISLANSSTTLYVGKLSGNTACSQTAGSATGCELMAFDRSTDPAGLLMGTMSGSHAFNQTFLSKNVSLLNQASTSNFTINVSGTTTLSADVTISGNYTNNGVFLNNATLYMASGTSQSLSGTLTNTSPLGNIRFQGAGTKTFGSNASTTNFTVDSGVTVVAPALLSIAGNYTNNGTTTAGTGTTTFNGTSGQIATGTMTGTSAFANLVITNTSGSGSGVQAVVFGSSASTTDTLTMNPGTSAQFRAGATSTFQNINLGGSAGQYVWLRSSVPGTQYNFYVPGTQKAVSYVDVQDNNACPTTITQTNSINSGNNLCWSFAAAGAGDIVLTGTLYSDEGVNVVTTGETIAIAIGTSTPSVHNSTTNAGGAWTYTVTAPVGYSTGTPITIWVDGDATTRASLFTKASSTLNNIPSLDLYQNRVIVSHEGTSGTSTTINNMSFYDYDNDNDIQYSAATTTNTLTVFSNQELHIKTGKTFAPGGNVTINANASTTSQTDGNFHISSSATYTAGGTTILGGNFMASSSAVFTPDRYATIMNASTTGKVVYPLTTSLGNMLFTGLSNSTYSFANKATTSDFYIATNATVTAPTLLTIAGNYVNVGGFVHNSGTVRMASTSSHFISGNTATSSAFNNLTIDGTGAVSFTELLQIATDTPASHLYPITIDNTNGVLYTGTGNSGLIYRCVLSTGCDSVGDYTTATDTPATTIYSLAVDSVNGTLYAGADAGGIIYRCALSTGCDSAGDFTNATDTAETVIFSLAVDSVNGTLYAGTNPAGLILRCALSTGCDSATDFTVASDTPSTFIYTLTVDSVNGTLYAGGSSGAVIYRCALSTGCDSAGDVTTAFTNVDSALYSLAVDSINGTLYAGTNNSAIIYRCALSTLCDASGDFTTAYDTPNSRVSALAIDSINGILFTGSDVGLIYHCALATLCDSAGDFSTATDTPEGTLYSFAIDSSNGTLYAALNTTGIVFKCMLCNGTYSSSTSNATLTLETGASFTSNREMRISGNYVNNGTSSPNTSVSTPTLVFTGSSAQSLSGTLTATSSLPYTTFIGSGTKTLSSNASTTGDVVIGSGSTVSIPNALSLGRNLESSGSITNSGTMYFTALGSNASGTLTGAGSLGNVSLTSTQDLFTVATDTGETAIYSLALDRVNQVLYAGTNPSGLIYRCALSTNCDSTTDFTVATDTAETIIHGMIVDPVNQVLYAGSGSSGSIYRCALSTGCDSVTDFTLPFASTSVSTVRAFTIDTTNQVLYAGTGSGGIILRCVLSTGCDAASEFTLAADTTTTIVYNLAFDATNGVLYLATGGTGIVLRCVVSTSCATLADFTTATDTPETTMYSIAIDSVNNVLYTGSGNNGRLFRCVLSTLCDSAGDFTLALDGSPQIMYSLTIDTTNNILYVGSANGGQGYIYRCILSTGCDSDSDFTTYYDTKETLVYGLVFNEGDNTIYGATGNSGYILRRANGITFNANASTSDLTIGTSTTLVAPPHLSVAGAYTNNGTFTAGSGTTTFSGASSQTLAGTMIATSSFNHVGFSGAGTKAFSNNASTSNFRIESGSGAVTAPAFLTIAGNYNNQGTFTANSGTTTFSSTTAQSITGIATGTSAFSTLVLTGTSTKTFASNASTTNVIIQNGATVVLPPLFSLTGNYINNGTTTAGTGTTTMNGTTEQVASGTMTGTSAFNNLAIRNTSGAGSSTQSIRFLTSASTTGTFSMVASTSAQFLAGATSTFQNVTLSGASGQNVYLRSSTPGTQYGFYVPGTQNTVSYVDVRDSSACPTIMLATDGTNVNSGNTACWSFAASTAVIASDAHQIFAYLQATTTINPITITDDSSSASVTTANDIRLIIATSTTNMRWDTTDTTATFGGTASGKVAGTVSYLGNGTILVIDVTTNFSAGDTLTISDLSYSQFGSVSPATVALGVRTAGVGTTTNNSDSKTVSITGTIAIGAHTSGQIDNAFTSRTVSGGELLAFKLTPGGESFAITNLAFPLKGVQGISTAELTNVSLYRDMNANQAYDAGDVAVGGSGSVSINGQTGTLTFSQSFNATTTQDYLLIGDADQLLPTDALVLALSSASLTTTGSTSLAEVTESGGIDDYQHIRGGAGAGGGGGAIGGAPPTGDGIRTGGGGGGGDDAGSNGGTTIGNEVGFNPPSSNSGSWTTGGNGYNSDGAYATANSSVSHTYGSFGFTVPNNNQITGIVVKLEASGSTAAGTISVRLSWDGGSSVTSLVTTDTLTTSDAVYELGSPSDLWGHSWTASEFNNGNFTIEVVANPSGNTVKIDAIQVRVYHQATGGGGGGGGAVFKEPSRYFANVYSAFGGALTTSMRSFLDWFDWD